MHYDMSALRARFPRSSIIGSFGNHDSSPGDVYYGDARQSWLYDNVSASLWGADLDASERVSLQRGGYFAHSYREGLTVVALNINYWVAHELPLERPPLALATRSQCFLHLLRAGDAKLAGNRERQLGGGRGAAPV